MAANLLPLVALAGAGALLMSRKKKKNGKKCPAQVVIAEMTESEITSIAKKAWEDAGADPILAADIVFKQLVPEGCTKKDYKTKVLSKQLSDFKPLDWNLSMLYAHFVTAVLEINIGMDDEDMFAWGRAVMQNVAIWYSQLTGEPLPDID